MPVRELRGGASSKEKGYHRVMLVGPTGSGKSSQIPTLSGPKLIYAFDPNCVKNIQEHLSPEDIILEFMPDPMELDIMPKSIKQKVGGQVDDINPRLYEDFIADHDDRRADGFFKKLGEAGGWLIMDSATYLQQACYDAVIVLQAKAGSADIRADAQVVGQRMLGVGRMLTSLPCNVLVTAHYRKWQSEDGSQTGIELEAYGIARRLLPGVFDNVLSTFVTVPYERNRLKEDGKPSFFVQTVADDNAPASRCGVKPLPNIIEEVTIDFSHDPIGQGIGKWFNPPVLSTASRKGKKAA